MPLITLHTYINAPVERVFDLARSLDMHTMSTGNTGETAVGGKTSGLIELNEWVEWRARHFGVWQRLSSKITEYKRPEYFTDEMIKGTFRSIKHRHIFQTQGSGTLMSDHFDYQSPLGVLGRLADKLFLENYLRRFITERNQHIKSFAESGRWKEVL